MEKRMILAVVLSVAVLFVFQKMTIKKTTSFPGKEEFSCEQKGEEKSRLATNDTKSGVDKNENAKKIHESGEIFSSENEILSQIETKNSKIIFSNEGGSLKKITLKDEKKRNENIIDAVNAYERPFALVLDEQAGTAISTYELIQEQGNEIVYAGKINGLEIKKTFKADKDKQDIAAEICVKNDGTTDRKISYAIIGPSKMLEGSSGKVSGNNFLETNIFIGDKIFKGKPGKGFYSKEGDILWVAQKNRYNAIILKPLQAVKKVNIWDSQDKSSVTSIEETEKILSPGEEIRTNYVMYAGMLDEEILNNEPYNAFGIVNYGVFGWLSKALLACLRFFHKWTGNWGVAIILLTLLVNFVLFPLTHKSFASMHKLKKIQPHMQKLREVHKDNPQKLNKEMMELYKKYNVNPFGGCLPLLLQMPIFVALYQGLMRSVELEKAPFLWIKDLARPDAVPLPFTLPLIGNAVNILPLLMVGMMVVQQKMTQAAAMGGMTEEQMAQQKMMMLVMPVVFGFLFYNMPSGLVLYWFTNTVLMTGEQKLIAQQLGA